MSSVVRLLVCFAAVSGLVAGVMSLQPAWFADLGLDVWAIPELQREIAEAQRLHEEMDQTAHTLNRLSAAREVVIAELLAGQLSLPEAVARFRSLNQECARSAEYTRAIFPAASDDESVCRQVLSWAAIRAWGNCPEREGELMAGLEDQARDFLAAAGAAPVAPKGKVAMPAMANMPDIGPKGATPPARYSRPNNGLKFAVAEGSQTFDIELEP
jgi:hypothetical protein